MIAVLDQKKENAKNLRLYRTNPAVHSQFLRACINQTICKFIFHAHKPIFRKSSGKDQDFLKRASSLAFSMASHRQACLRPAS
ncbi:MAG: hypothetical protein JJ969_18830 [Rhizobiaceae bacterium]|nr:hypothetical protein [Rhizobiaceae bacterium]